MLPHQVEQTLHIHRLTRHRNDGILIRQDDAELPERAAWVTTGVASLGMPTDIVRRCSTFSAARFALLVGGTCPGKKSTTLSDKCSLPAATANPTAVEVKLLLSE
jgi:hypothetical protein